MLRGGATIDGLSRRDFASALDVSAVAPPIVQVPRLRIPVLPPKWLEITIALLLTPLATLTSFYAVNQTMGISISEVQAQAMPTAPISTPAQVPGAGELQKVLDGFIASYPAPMSAMVIDLTSGQTAEINADRQMISASLYKLFVAREILHLADIGKLDLASSAGHGTGRTIRGCLEAMIIVSDNGCGAALGERLNWGKQDAGLSAQGYLETTLATPQQTSARDVARMLRRLYDGTLLSPASTEILLNHLKAQRINNRLPQGLPTGTVVAHKTGDLYGYVHDAGIIYSPGRTYLVSVMSGPWDAPYQAPQRISDLSNRLYAHFNGIK